MNLKIQEIHISVDNSCNREISMMQKSFNKMIQDHIFRFINIVKKNPELEQTFRTEIHFDDDQVFVIAMAYDNNCIECAVGMLNGRTVNSNMTQEQALNVNLFMSDIKMALYKHEKAIMEKGTNISKVSLQGKYRTQVRIDNIQIPMYGGSLNRQPYLEEKKYDTYVHLNEREER